MSMSESAKLKEALDAIADTFTANWFFIDTPIWRWSWEHKGMLPPDPPEMWDSRKPIGKPKP